MGRAHLREAVRRLDLVRLLPDGLRRLSRRFGPPLSPDGERALRRSGACRIHRVNDRISTMKTWRLIVPLAVFAILLGFLWVGLSLDPREVPSPVVGKPAPSFSLATLHEPAKSLTRDDMKGQVWLLNVWASWCVSCRSEHP